MIELVSLWHGAGLDLSRHFIKYYVDKFHLYRTEIFSHFY